MTQKVKTRLTLTDTSTKFGLVTIRTQDGEFVQSYKIDAVEADLIRNGVRRVPSGCPVELWEMGQSTVETFCVFPGQAVVFGDGTLLVCYSAEKKDKQFLQGFLSLQPSEFEVIDEGVYVVPTLKAQVEAGV